MNDNELKELALDVIETYAAVSLDDNFDASEITEETYLGVVYSDLIYSEVVKPTEEGLKIINVAKTELGKLYEELEAAEEDFDDEDYEDDFDEDEE